MLFKVLAVAAWAAVSVVSAASAQSLRGPAENPPAGFKGSQYVDSRGCVFLRAGIGGRVNWVPRISRDRKALCGQSRSSAARDAAVAEAAPVPAPRTAQPSTSGSTKPMETIASLRPTAPPVMAKPAPQPVLRAPAVAAIVPKAVQPRLASGVERQSGCPRTSPFGARVTLADGRRTLLCSADAGFDVQAAASRIQVARSAPQPALQPAPAYTPRATSGIEAGVSAGGGYRCPPDAPVARRYDIRGGGSTVMCTALNGGIDSATPPLALGNRSQMTVPDGYKPAWNDDRLNPNRARGTARGQAQQDQVWTRDIPAQLATNQTVRKTVKRTVYATSTSNAPRATKGGRYYVQVGTFGEPANAARSAARLQGLGLPVAKSRITSKGRNLQIVMAGPFGDAGAANAALAAARRSGFGDAFIR
ncbi:SPOR domain-containing protein [Pseudorhodobacter ferrugineus]|uniref:SPOR domain-containing protein n=1 Tax=Pseudorhodobacter ferrugineus TaxID=77008 RepID=UPI0003B42DD3|nr:SPOR domain-containing protein [Pseudorhodobacter ferrugineus]